MAALKKQLLEVLRDYMSGILAGSVLNLATRWSRTDLEKLGSGDGARFLAELEKGVRLYVADSGQRSECLERVEEKIVVGGGGGAPGPVRERPVTAPVSRGGPAPATKPATKQGKADNRYSIVIASEVDVLAARGASREIAAEVGFGAPDQIRVATVISELARHILRSGGNGRLSITVLWKGRRGVEVTAEDPGLDFEMASRVSRDADLPVDDDLLGIAGARKLMDDFEVESTGDTGCVLRLRRFV